MFVLTRTDDARPAWPDELVPTLTSADCDAKNWPSHEDASGVKRLSDGARVLVLLSA